MRKNAEYKLLYVKRRLFQTKVNITGIISNGSVHHVPRQKTIGLIRKEIGFIANKLGLADSEINMLYQQSLSQLDTIMKSTGRKLRSVDTKFGKKEQYQENLMQRQAVIAHTVQRNYIGNNRLLQEMNSVAYQVEQRMKTSELENLLKDSYSRASYSPFFLASAHPHPAKDHAAYEAKYYFDENWRNYAAEDDVYKIESYIRNHKLKTIQWVTGDGIWFSLRKNCKHFFTNVPLNEVLHSSVKKALKKHGMYHEDNESVSRARLTYREYYNRLKIQTKLYEVSPSDELKKEIKRTKVLLNKWSKLI